MLVKILKNEFVDYEFIKCPHDKESYKLPYCRKKCSMFKGYKTTEDGQRNMKCNHP